MSQLRSSGCCGVHHYHALTHMSTKMFALRAFSRYMPSIDINALRAKSGQCSYPFLFIDIVALWAKTLVVMAMMIMIAMMAMIATMMSKALFVLFVHFPYAFPVRETISIENC
ncbi:MAG: hypothetical protein LBJ72_02830 [Dysgonamonadaceae bacterium]|nr:hypothetical protein [Dysgonamonadaceae bacterium]